MAEILPLYTKTATGEQEAVVSVDVGLVVGIGEQRQLTLRTMLNAKLPLAEQKRIVRDLLSIGDVEKAHYELQDLLGDLVIRERSLKRCEEDVERVGKKHEKRRAEIKAEVELLNVGKVEAAETHEREFRADGRQGKFRPSQQQQNEITNIGRDIDRLEAELKTITETEEGERRDILTALARARQDLGTCREEIAKRRVILGLPQE